MSQQCKAGREWKRSVNPKTPTTHNQPMEGKKEKIVGDKKKEKIMPTGKHWLSS